MPSSYYRARYYHPTLQRFVSEDPLGFAGSGPNSYSYTSNSPTNFGDPSGLTIAAIGGPFSQIELALALEYLRQDPGMWAMISDMERSDTV
jgi:hypothetical protein